MVNSLNQKIRKVIGSCMLINLFISLQANDSFDIIKEAYLHNDHLRFESTVLIQDNLDEPLAFEVGDAVPHKSPMPQDRGVDRLSAEGRVAIAGGVLLLQLPAKLAMVSRVIVSRQQPVDPPYPVGRVRFEELSQTLRRDPV